MKNKHLISDIYFLFTLILSLAFLTTCGSDVDNVATEKLEINSVSYTHAITTTLKTAPKTTHNDIVESIDQIIVSINGQTYIATRKGSINIPDDSTDNHFQYIQIYDLVSSDGIEYELFTSALFDSEINGVSQLAPPNEAAAFIQISRIEDNNQKEVVILFFRPTLEQTTFDDETKEFSISYEGDSEPRFSANGVADEDIKLSVDTTIVIPITIEIQNSNVSN